MHSLKVRYKTSESCMQVPVAAAYITTDAFGLAFLLMTASPAVLVLEAAFHDFVPLTVQRGFYYCNLDAYLWTSEFCFLFLFSLRLFLANSQPVCVFDNVDATCDIAVRTADHNVYPGAKCVFAYH